MRSIEATGKSVDAAIFSGLQQLGISIDEVTIDIIQMETKGILGIGAKPAKVRLTEKLPEDVVVPDFKAERERERSERRERRENRTPRRDNSRNEEKGGAKVSEEQSEERRPERRRTERRKPYKSIDEMFAAQGKIDDEKVESNVETPDEEFIGEATCLDLSGKSSMRFDIEAKTDNAKEEHISKIVHEAEAMADEMEYRESYKKKPAKTANAKKKNNSPRPEKPEKVEKSVQVEQKQETEPVNYTEEAAEGCPAAEFVKGLIEHMGVDGKVLAAVEEGNAKLRIDSDAMGVLIGHRGETLDSIQYLTSLVVNRNRKTEGYTRITINTEDYREKREETLIKLAKRVAQQVKATGKARILEPMNPYERRILHSALQGNPFVATHSEGEEPNRRVVVTPKRRNRNYSNRRNDYNKKQDASRVESTEVSVKEAAPAVEAEE